MITDSELLAIEARLWVQRLSPAKRADVDALIAEVRRLNGLLDSTGNFCRRNAKLKPRETFEFHGTEAEWQELLATAKGIGDGAIELPQYGNVRIWSVQEEEGGNVSAELVRYDPGVYDFAQGAELEGRG